MYRMWWFNDIKLLPGFFMLFVVIESSFVLGMDRIELLPDEHEVLKFKNESYIVVCSTRNNLSALQWTDPTGNEITSKNPSARIHISDRSNENITSLALVFTHFELDDIGNYSCSKVDGRFGAMQWFTLKVKVRINFLDTPNVEHGKLGEQVFIRCEASGDPEPEIAWSFNGKDIPSNSTKYSMATDGLLVKNLTLDDGGEYTCKAYQRVNTFIKDEHVILLNIIYAPNVTMPPSYYGFIGSKVNITCKVDAEPPAEIIFYKDNKNIRDYTIYEADHNNKTRLVPDPIFSLYEDTNQLILEVDIRKYQDFGTYLCNAKNSVASNKSRTLLKKFPQPNKPLNFKLDGRNSVALDVEVQPSVESNKTEITHYRFEYVTAADYNQSMWNKSKTVDLPTKNEKETNYVIAGLTPETKYKVRVASKNIAGYSEYTLPKDCVTDRAHVNKASQISLLKSNFYGILVFIQLSFTIGAQFVR